MVIAVISLPNFIASAYTMPADQLVKLSNKQLCDKGEAHWDKNQIDSALICFSIVSNRADQKQTREEMSFVVTALIKSAVIIHDNFNDYERSMHYFLEAEKIATKYQFRLDFIYQWMAIIEHQISDIQNGFAFSSESFELYKKSFQQYVKNGNLRYASYPLSNLINQAFCYHKLDEIQEELHLYHKLPTNDTIELAKFVKHQCDAAIYASKKQYDLALKELKQLVPSIEPNINEASKANYQCVAHFNMFLIYQDMGNYTSALRELDHVERIARDHNFKKDILETLMLRRNFYALWGEKELASEFEVKYLKAKNQLMAEAKVAKADEEKVLFRLNEANNEIKELSYKQRIQQTELIAVAVVALLLLTLLVLAWVSHRQTKEKNRSLYEQNQQLLANIDRMRQLRQEQERREKEQQAQASEAQTASIPAAKYGRGKMEGDDIAQVIDRVERVLESAPEIFSVDFSLDQLAQLTGETESRLSQAINTSGRTFYSMLNEYRVHEACRRMNDKAQYGGLTIEAIGQSVGFKNRSHFVTTFKRITGLTPSAYLKQPPEPHASESHADTTEV